MERKESKIRINLTNLTAFLNKDWNLAAGMIIVLFFVGIIAGYHQAQVEQGVGLYYSIYFHSSDRLLYDILADVVRFLTIFLANLIPCILLKRCRLVSYLHILELYLAFMPITHMSDLINYFSQEEMEWILPAMEWCPPLLAAAKWCLAYFPTIKWCLMYLGVIFFFGWLEKLYENNEKGKIWSKAFDALLILKIVHKLVWFKYY